MLGGLVVEERSQDIVDMSCLKSISEVIAGNQTYLNHYDDLRKLIMT